MRQNLHLLNRIPCVLKERNVQNRCNRPSNSQFIDVSPRIVPNQASVSYQLHSLDSLTAIYINNDVKSYLVLGFWFPTPFHMTLCDFTVLASTPSAALPNANKRLNLAGWPQRVTRKLPQIVIGGSTERSISINANFKSQLLRASPNSIFLLDAVARSERVGMLRSCSVRPTTTFST